jgi:glycosyltransferase involved in cell wall biosynthesis
VETSNPENTDSTFLPTPSGPSGIFMLAGLHRIPRGAEVALESVATELSRLGHDLTLIGNGGPRADRPYKFQHVWFKEPATFRKFPTFPPFRTEESWSGASFFPGAWRATRKMDVDYGFTCSFPWEWAALGRAPRKRIFVTQNGDWCAREHRREYRMFNTDGLVCTNPEYYERNKDRWRSVLIPNGIDTARFSPGKSTREELSLPDGPLVVIVSALIESKRVEHALRAVHAAGAPAVAVFGKGVLDAKVDAVGKELFGNRYSRSTLTPEQMPQLYRSADLLVHMSKDESFGNIYVEALACGVPVVAHRYSVTEWIYSDTMDCVDLVDSDSLLDTASAIQKMLQNPVADGVLKAGSDVIRGRFSWTQISAAYDTFIRAVITG